MDELESHGKTSGVDFGKERRGIEWGHSYWQETRSNDVNLYTINNHFSLG